MNDHDRPSNLPTILVAILALFGLATIPQGQGKRPEGTEASAKASVEGAGHKSEAKGPNRLGPLNTLKEYWGKCGPYAIPPGDPSVSEERRLLAWPSGLQFLIVLIPDPDGKSMSHEFDSTLSAVLRATESAGYVAVRYWFPWEPPTRDQSKDETKPTHFEATLAGPLSVNGTVVKKEESNEEGQPGGVLCRRVSRSKRTKNESNRSENQLLMVLLVPETPIWGVDKTRLGQAFKIVDNYRELHYPDGSAPIRIVGPNFSGSIPSMVMEMQTWPGPDDTCRPRFVIYNGAALEPQLGVLREAFPDVQVTFRSTVHNTWTLVKALRKFTLETSISDTCPIRRAVLTESNTVFG